jgi:hypothetical protein
MATTNRPTFPDPALEVGVAQYPTPLVPDYYTKNGHIILVEKVSIEKGSYNPQPLDGSVIYSKRDAGDWPDNLYLVFQQTEPTGKFVFNYWANDRTLASQDPWNYGLTYSLNDPTTPIVTRLYIVPRDEYATVPLGSVDPVFGGDAIVASQTMAELPDDNPLRSRYVQVQRVYETIPSSVITGKRLTERGDIETLDTQVVVAGTAPDADGLLVTQTAIEAIDAVKSKRTKGSVASYSTLTTKAKKAGLLGEVSISDDIVAPSTNPDSLTTSIIDSTVEAISATKSRKRTTTSTGPTSLVAKKISERGDTQTITKSIVASNAEVTADALLLVSSQVDEIDSAKSQKTDVTVTSYSTLTTKSNKGGLLGEVLVSDDIVDPSTNPDALSEEVLESTVEAISATKSRKRTTTSTGPTSLSGVGNKAGLLGEVETTEEIVEYGELPIALSATVLQSEVTPIDSYKSKRTTVESTGPTSLTNDEKKSGLLGATTTVESIVAAGDAPDDLSTTILQSTVTAIDSAKSKKTTITASGPSSLSGKSTKAGLLGRATTTESIVAAGADADALSLSVIQSAITPIDSAKSKKTTVTASGPTSLVSKKISERGDVQTITKSIVSASTGTTTDSLNLVSSEVEDIDEAKSQKTDVTVSAYSALTSKSNKSGLLGNTSITDEIVSPSTDPDALSTTVIDSSVESVSATKARKRTTTSTGPAALNGKVWHEFGVASASESIVAYGEAAPINEKVLKSQVDPIDLAKSKLSKVEYDSTEILDGYQYDADLGLVIHTTKELIAEGTSPLSVTDGTIAYKDEPINAWQSVRIVSKISSLPAARTEYKTGAYASPNLVYGFNTFTNQLKNWDLNVSIYPVMRAKRSYQTVFKHVTSYVYGQPTPSYVLYDPVAVNIFYDGYFFKLNIPECLTDQAWPIVVSTPNNDPVHGFTTETYYIPLSTETASNYLAKVGTYQLIAYEIDYWKANIWRKVEQYVLLK